MNRRLQFMFVGLSIFSTSSLIAHIFSYKAHIIKRKQVQTLVPTLLSTDVYNGSLQEFVSKKVIRQIDAQANFSNNITVSDDKFHVKVHFIWCSRWMFEFRHYLSVLSVWKIMKPEEIILHQATVPKVNKYNDWIGTLKKTVKGFVLKDYTSVVITGKDNTCGLKTITKVLQENGGGVYVDAEVIVTEEVNKLITGGENVYISKSRKNTDAAILRIEEISVFKVIYQKSRNATVCKVPGIQKQKTELISESHMNLSNSENISSLNAENGVKNISSDISDVIQNRSVALMYNITMHYRREETNTTCYLMEDDIYPRDIFVLKTAFGVHGRKLLFDSAETKQAKKGLPGTIPKIAHYVWYGNTVMTYRMYLSMLSTLYVLKATKVYIHGDGALYGKLFDRIRRNKNVIIVKSEPSETMFGRQQMYLEHSSDKLRAGCLLKYGGIYMDWDVVWLRDPDDLINTGYDAIASYDHIPQRGTQRQSHHGGAKTSVYHTTYPDTINLGILMAKPGSAFVNFWQEALAKTKPNEFIYNSVELPYRVFEQHPESLYIERRLQVICFQLKCHPAFHPNYKVVEESQPFNWREDVYSIHFTYPDPDELAKEDFHNNGTGMFAEIRKFLISFDQLLD